MIFETFEDSSIKLRALEPEDLSLFFTIENTPNLWSSSNSTVPYSKYALKNYIESQQGDIFADKELRLVIESKENECKVGMIDLYNFNPLHQRAEVGVIILKEYQSQGFATNALKIVIDYAFNFLLLHQLYAKISIENSASLKLFEKAGFKTSGILKDWFFGTKSYVDAYIVQLYNSHLVNY